MLASRIVEEECNGSSTHEIIQVSPCKCTGIKEKEKFFWKKKSQIRTTHTAVRYFFSLSHVYKTLILYLRKRGNIEL